MAHKPKKQPPKKLKTAAWRTSENMEQAVLWLMDGNSVEAIAASLEIQIEQAQELIDVGLEKKTRENFIQATRLRLARLDRALIGIMPAVDRGEEPAINKMIQLEAEIMRTKLMLNPDLKRVFKNRSLLELAGLEAHAEKKRGRPAHKPNEYYCQLVENMAHAGYSQDRIAAAVGITDDTLRLHYAKIIETARPVMVTEAVTVFTDQMLKKAKAGDTADVRWYIQRIAPPEWKEAQQLRPEGSSRTDPAGTEVHHVVEIEGGLPLGSTPGNPEGTAAAEPSPSPDGETVSGSTTPPIETI